MPTYFDDESARNDYETVQPGIRLKKSRVKSPFVWNWNILHPFLFIEIQHRSALKDLIKAETYSCMLRGIKYQFQLNLKLLLFSVSFC